MKSLLPVLVTTLMISMIAFPHAQPSAHAAAKAGADDLRRLEADFMKAAAEKGADGYVSYYADDAVEVPNGEAIIHGKSEIAKTMGFLNDKNNQLTWTPVGADISASGDLGYTYGTYEFSSKDKDGKPVLEYGKYTSTSGSSTRLASVARGVHERLRRRLAILAV